MLGQGQTPPSQKLNIAGIGVGGMGSGDVASCAQAGENIVALCDPDSNHLAANAKKYPGAKLYTDFRKMLETQKDIDAVTIATPDHVHAVATAMAMKLGKHVHCQKPLTHSVYEARMIGKLARETKVATQMGNFGQAGEEPRRVAETDLGRRDRHPQGGACVVQSQSGHLPARRCRGPRRLRPARRTWTGTSGSAPPPCGPIIPAITRLPGAAGGISAPACSATSAAMSSPPSSRP